MMKHRLTSLLEVLIVVAALSSVTAINKEFFRAEQEVPPPSLPPTVKSSPCRKTKMADNDVKAQLIPHDKFQLTGKDLLGSHSYENVPETNCTEDDSDGTSVQPVLYDRWKLHIIMACTVTAAVEFVLIIFIILYWRQIRWTLRKITCPCDGCRGHHHEAMDAEGDPDGRDAEAETDSLDFGTIPMGLRPSPSTPRAGTHSVQVYPDSRVHMYSAPRMSRVLSASDCDEPIPGPSGLSHSPKPGTSGMFNRPVSFQIVTHRYSSSDESLTEIQIPVSPSIRGHEPRIKGSKGKRLAGKTSAKTDGELNSNHEIKVPMGSDTGNCDMGDPLGATSDKCKTREGKKVSCKEGVGLLDKVKNERETSSSDCDRNTGCKSNLNSSPELHDRDESCSLAEGKNKTDSSKGSKSKVHSLENVGEADDLSKEGLTLDKSTKEENDVVKTVADIHLVQ